MAILRGYRRATEPSVNPAPGGIRRDLSAGSGGNHLTSTRRTAISRLFWST
jgi:hypothetical protein